MNARVASEPSHRRTVEAGRSMRAGTIRGPMHDQGNGWYGSTHPASSRSPLYISRRIPNRTGIGGVRGEGAWNKQIM